jgi:Ca2+-binding EF-hand superfamily protein
MPATELYQDFLYFCISAFKEVFDLFDSNGGGTIDAEELDLALRSVGICLSEDDIIGVLESMDKDGM